MTPPATPTLPSEKWTDEFGAPITIGDAMFWINANDAKTPEEVRAKFALIQRAEGMGFRHVILSRLGHASGMGYVSASVLGDDDRDGAADVRRAWFELLNARAARIADEAFGGASVPNFDPVPTARLWAYIGRGLSDTREAWTVAGARTPAQAPDAWRINMAYLECLGVSGIVVDALGATGRTAALYHEYYMAAPRGFLRGDAAGGKGFIGEGAAWMNDEDLTESQESTLRTAAWMSVRWPVGLRGPKGVSQAMRSACDAGYFAVCFQRDLGNVNRMVHDAIGRGFTPVVNRLDIDTGLFHPPAPTIPAPPPPATVQWAVEKRAPAKKGGKRK